MDNEKQAERFTNGFNDGYLLSKHEPELMKKLVQYTRKDNAYFNGMASGNVAYQREAFLEDVQKTRMAQTQKPKMK